MQVRYSQEPAFCNDFCVTPAIPFARLVSGVLDEAGYVSQIHLLLQHCSALFEKSPLHKCGLLHNEVKLIYSEFVSLRPTVLKT